MVFNNEAEEFSVAVVYDIAYFLLEGEWGQLLNFETIIFVLQNVHSVLNFVRFLNLDLQIL